MENTLFIIFLWGMLATQTIAESFCLEVYSISCNINEAISPNTMYAVVKS